LYSTAAADNLLFNLSLRATLFTFSTPVTMSDDKVMMEVDNTEEAIEVEVEPVAEPPQLQQFVRETLKMQDPENTIALTLERVFDEAKASKNWPRYNKDRKCGYLAAKIEEQLNLPPEARREDVAERLLKHMTSVLDNDRLVSVGYEIKKSTLSHNYDVLEFSDRIKSVFRGYFDEAKANSEQEYISPYFCVVQSSGMGKTKILFEFKSNVMELLKHDKVECRLVLSGPFDVNKEDNVFDGNLNLGAIADEHETLLDAASGIYNELDRIFIKVLKKDTNKLVILFDEAQWLLVAKFGFPVFIFRCIRVWLREKRRTLQIVAVFTGTNAKLRNFLFDDDKALEETPINASRGWKRERDYHDRGPKRFPLFMNTTTIGCRLGQKYIEGTEAPSEYKQAVAYGRPLFASMNERGDLDDARLWVILRRMLLDTEWQAMETTWLNILATRVQMGQTSVTVASDLVARAYANLTSCGDGAAQICYLPDPVCARLAMCMMDDSWSLPDPHGNQDLERGKNPVWWVEKMEEVYSRGLCRPEKGDIGEVMVALYLLFCGDVLRRMDKTYETFSVPLGDWIDLLLSGGSLSSGKPAAGPRSSSRLKQHLNATVSFVQVCRNYLRSYGPSWKAFKDQVFLEHLYKSGTAFYAFSGCSIIDLVAPIRIETGGSADGFQYVPLLVSIKSRYKFSRSEVESECKRMEEKASRDGCTNGLCLLVVFGSPMTVKADDPRRLKRDVVSQVFGKGKVACKVLRIPVKDVFGLSHAFTRLTSMGEEPAEIFASHAFVRAHAHSNNEDQLDPDTALRSLDRSAVELAKGLKAVDMLKTLSHQLQLKS